VDSFFGETEDIVEAVRDASPDDANVHPVEDTDQGKTERGRVANWFWQSNYVVEVDTDKILFMVGNTWNFEHAAAVADAMRDGATFEIPAGRVHRITAAHVKNSQEHDKKGDLEEQYGMTRPWSKADIGNYYAQLIDGNHRAVAAMVLREPSIPVYVGENYRENIRKKDWI